MAPTSEPDREPQIVWTAPNRRHLATSWAAACLSDFRAERLHPPKAYEGTGIGLAIARKGIRRMGGHIGVQSELGKGSKFWIELKKAG